jgi:hypothetical protein
VESSTTQLPGTDVTRERRAWRIRTAVLVVVAVFVVAGLFEQFGVQTRTVSGEGAGGLHVTVTYAARTRPALAVPFAVRVTRPGGFDHQIEISTTTSYLEAFDENGLNPDPDSATTDGSTTTWTYDPPDGDTFTLWLDTRIEPGVQWRRRGTTEVRTGDDTVTVRYTSWIFP